MRIVLDTNVLLSGILTPHGAPGSVVNAVLDNRFTVLLDDCILLEYRDVLKRPRFAFPSHYVQALLEFFEHHGEHVIAGPRAFGVADPADLPFYEVAIAGAADYLVTGNDKHFPQEPLVVSPKAFVDLLRSRE